MADRRGFRVRGVGKALPPFRDDFIDVVNDLEERQAKSDNAIVAAAGDLQKILTPEEWTALVRTLAPAP